MNESFISSVFVMPFTCGDDKRFGVQKKQSFISSNRSYPSFPNLFDNDLGWGRRSLACRQGSCVRVLVRENCVRARPVCALASCMPVPCALTPCARWNCVCVGAVCVEAVRVGTACTPVSGTLTLCVPVPCVQRCRVRRYRVRWTPRARGCRVRNAAACVDAVCAPVPCVQRCRARAGAVHVLMLGAGRARASAGSRAAAWGLV